MNLSLVSVRYAKALFKLSAEKGIMEKVYKDIILLSGHYKDNDDFRMFMQSPVVKKEKKKALLQDVYKDALNPITLGAMNLIIDNNREVIIDAVFRSFTSFYREEKNIKIATLYSAFEMDKQFQDEVKLIVAKELNCDVELSVVVKTELLGGFILKVDDKMVDASILGKLNRVRKHLVKG